MSVFSERVSELMKRQRLSQKLLAEKVGVTESAMSLYVRDKRTPRSDVLARIAKALGVASDYLLGIDDAFTAPKENKGFCIEIPENATNGDMVKAVLGEPAKEGRTGLVYKFMYRNGKPMFSTYFDIEWWNAPYRKEGIKDGKGDTRK